MAHSDQEVQLELQGKGVLGLLVCVGGWGEGGGGGVAHSDEEVQLDLQGGRLQGFWVCVCVRA